MSSDNCLVDLQTKTINPDVWLDRFLYIEWNSERTQGGAGIGHILYSISSLLRYYVFSEQQHRTFIFSDKWRPDWERHSPNSTKTVVDIQNYYNIAHIIGQKFNVPIKTYFDHDGIFRDNFTTDKTIGISSLIEGVGLTKVRENNKNFVEVKQTNEHKILQFDYNFWCGGFHDVKPTGPTNVPRKKIYLPNYKLFSINQDLKTKAKIVLDQIKSNQPTTICPFIVMHLRRGDRLTEMNLANSSEVGFISQKIKENFPKESSIYIMTNGTAEYVQELKTALKSASFNIFTKNDFEGLAELGDDDNFALFTLENELCDLCDLKITNRSNSPHKPRLFSLIYEYVTQPREIIFAENGDLFVQIGEEHQKYKPYKKTKYNMFAFGIDGKYVYKDIAGSNFTFNNSTFSDASDSSKLKHGYIKVGSKTDLFKIGYEDSSYISDTSYTALYGVGEKFFCKREVTGPIVFDNSVFGDPSPGNKKEAYIIC